MKKTIMLVDDEPDLLEVVAALLGNSYEIVTASDYDEALLALKTYNVNGIITDLNLSNGTGLELLEHVAKNYPKINSALFTGDSDPRIQASAKNSGAMECLCKPFNTKRLMELAKNLVVEKESTVASL